MLAQFHSQSFIIFWCKRSMYGGVQPSTLYSYFVINKIKMGEPVPLTTVLITILSYWIKKVLTLCKTGMISLNFIYIGHFVCVRMFFFFFFNSWKWALICTLLPSLSIRWRALYFCVYKCLLCCFFRVIILMCSSVSSCFL